LLHQARIVSAEIEVGKEPETNRVEIEKSWLPELFEKVKFDPATFKKEDLVSVNLISFDHQRMIDIVWDLAELKNAFLRRIVTYKETLVEGKLRSQRKEEWFLDFRKEEDFLKAKREQAAAIDKYYSERQKRLDAYGFTPSAIQEMRRREVPPEHKREYSYIKTHPETFGEEIAESMARKALKTLHFVQEVEPATHEENQNRNKQVDFWLKLEGVEKPFGIKFTVVKEPDLLNEKIDTFVKNRREVIKTDFPDSLIRGGKEPLPVILVNMDGLPFSRALRKWQELDDYVPQAPFDGRLLYPKERLAIITRLLENAKRQFPFLAKEIAEALPAFGKEEIPELTRREIEPEVAA